MSKETLCPLQLSNLMDEIKFRMSYLFLNYAGLDILPITHLVSFIKPRLNVNLCQDHSEVMEATDGRYLAELCSDLFGSKN